MVIINGKEYSPEDAKKIREEMKKKNPKLAEGFKETFPEDEAIELLKNPNLLQLIKSELDKSHLLDDREKLAAFLFALTGYLNPPKLRRTANFLGNSSVGKDNLILSILNLFPSEDWIFLTGATQSTIEDDIDKFKIIAFSELNTNKESGANKHLVEVLKQVTEGGTSSLKKDILKGFKQTKHSKQEQKAVLWGSTEIKKDDELETRGTCITVLGHPTKTKAVNDKSCEDISNLDYILEQIKKKESWVAFAIRYLSEKKRLVYCPFMKFIKDSFDFQDPRSQRDVKRFISIVLAIAWILQEQRDIIEKNGYEVVIAQPIDILYAVDILKPFLNQTYAGFDARLNKVLDLLNEGEKSRADLQKKINVSTNTIKDWVDALIDKGLVEYVYEGRELVRKNNSPILRSLSVAYQKPIISISISELKKILSLSVEKQTDRLLIGYCQAYSQAIRNFKPLNLRELSLNTKYIVENVEEPISD